MGGSSLMSLELGRWAAPRSRLASLPGFEVVSSFVTHLKTHDILELNASFINATLFLGI